MAPQQRLLSVALGLRLVEARLATHPVEAELVASSRSELEQSLQELREVAHGIHPAVLSDHGLAVALETVVARSPVPVRLSMELDGRLPEPIEAAAYYLVCEALTNTAKHAHASKATVQISCHDGWVRIEVADDGRGGADMANGSGLRGLADRVAALDGRFVVDQRRRRWHRDQRGDPMRLIVADDSLLLREGISRLLVEAGFQVVGLASTG